MKPIQSLFGTLLLVFSMLSSTYGEEAAISLQEARLEGAKNSKYRKAQSGKVTPNEGATPKANLEVYHKEIQPLLKQACSQCHGPDKQKADFRVDTLEPDLLTGKDVNWWVEVLDVISNGEMPPEDGDVKLSDDGRSKLVDWLTREIQVASQVRRLEEGHTSFRRLTKYEYNYALQDLLGLNYDFASDLPPETASEDGFKNSSEMLQMSVMQFETYRDLGRKALQKATVKGDKPAELYFAIDLAQETTKLLEKKRDPKISDRDRKQFEKVGTSSPHYFDSNNNEAIANYRINLRGQPFPSSETLAPHPETTGRGMVVPGKGMVTLNLGPALPDTGNLKVRIRAAQIGEEATPPRLRLSYAFQASNNSHAAENISERDLVVSTEAGAKFYQWTAPLVDITRNPFRGKRIPKINSTESILIENTNPNKKSAVFIDYVEVTSPAYDQWPPKSHSRVFPYKDNGDDELAYVRKTLANFMQSTWRRKVTDEEIDRKLAHYQKIRPSLEHQQDALIEVMANILASPNFLYLIQTSEPDSFEIATRLSSFLWSSMPDEQLLELASAGKLNQPKQLQQQVDRMLADSKSKRFSNHFVRQWLGMDLLDYLDVDKKLYKQFNSDLKRSMQQEPIALFNEVLVNNRSILDFIHADYVMADDILGMHYRLKDHQLLGGELEPVSITDQPRGGLLTQAGLLAMNSDGKDSHPLKRGIWLLEKILNDPPPPPPPSVPEIDIADPEIAKMSLKERMEDHRNAAACMSCHARIDPWGIAFENFDAIGSWRDQINKQPVEASATLFNGSELRGIEGLKRYLLLNRQDQFTNALVHKLSAYALGRPISFADRADLEEITSNLRRDGNDGLKTLVSLIVTSDLFQN